MVIDRTKSKKVDTLPNISLYGNVTFPVEGGLALRPLAGIGTALEKSKAQVAKLAGRGNPIAGATGATVTDEEPAPEPRCQSTTQISRSETYAVRFIQHASEPPEHPTLQKCTVEKPDQFASQRLKSGYALKHGAGKKTTFSQAQKNIMIEFYNRQATNSIRAEPKDAMKAMEEAGLEVLSAKQIRSWWSTYHRKM